MRSYVILVNGQEHGEIEAADYRTAKKLARMAFGRRVDIIG